jgi:DNA-binding transcriptional MocR family regulator
MSTGNSHKVLLRAEHEGLHFSIETEGPEVGGYFLWVKRDDGSDIDELFEDTIDRCKSLALEKFGVPLNSWR